MTDLIKVINEEQANLKDKVYEAVKAFEDATGLDVMSVEFKTTITKINCGRIKSWTADVSYAAIENKGL